MTHRYAEALRWIADGKDVQIRWGINSEWIEMSKRNEIVNDEVLRGAGEYEFRLKPRTVKIGKFEVEAPVLKATEGQLLWYWDFANSRPTELRCTTPTWDDWLKEGRFFLSESACEAAHEAVAALLRGEA